MEDAIPLGRLGTPARRRQCLPVPRLGRCELHHRHDDRRRRRTACCPKAATSASCRHDPRFRRRFLPAAGNRGRPSGACHGLPQDRRRRQGCDRGGRTTRDCSASSTPFPIRCFEPDLAFVVDGPDGVSGYLLGALDTRAFNARLAAEWYPRLQAACRRSRTRQLDAGAAATGRGTPFIIPISVFPTALAAYPSHGHIDLLPEARGKGIGRRAMALPRTAACRRRLDRAVHAARPAQ